MKSITVLIAEDHLIVREGLQMLLSLDHGLQLVGTAQHGRQAVDLTIQLRPMVVLMDIAMPQLNGLEATRQILKLVASTKIILLSAHTDDAYVSSAIEAGAVGFLNKQSPVTEISQAIRAVVGGKTFFTQAVSQRFERSNSGKVLASLATLTSREHEVLQLIAEGKANKETASLLGISIKTVEKHRQSLMEKLMIHDTAGLTRYAIGAGIIESPVQATTRSAVL